MKSPTIPSVDKDAEEVELAYIATDTVAVSYKVKYTYDSAIPLLRIYSREMKTYISTQRLVQKHTQQLSS